EGRGRTLRAGREPRPRGRAPDEHVWRDAVGRRPHRVEPRGRGRPADPRRVDLAGRGRGGVRRVRARRVPGRARDAGPHHGATVVSRQPASTGKSAVADVAAMAGPVVELVAGIKPIVIDETRGFWEGTAAEELRVQVCG